jgi:hypothetical protein
MVAPLSLQRCLQAPAVAAEAARAIDVALMEHPACARHMLSPSALQLDDADAAETQNVRIFMLPVCAVICFKVAVPVEGRRVNNGLA